MSSAMTGTSTITRPETPDSSGSTTTRVGLLALSVVAVIAALVCVAVFGVQAMGAYATKDARDEATQAAEQAVLNITTIDPANIDDFRQRAEGSLTGKAKQEVLGDATDGDEKAGDEKAGETGNVLDVLAEAGENTAKLSARLLRSAPSEVDDEGGKAKVLVYVLTTLQRAGEPNVDQTRGFQVSMTREGDTWKAENVAGLEGIEYADAGQAPATGGGN
ncbi:hypothetical protein R4227_17110 [Gordonia amicalis]|nr:hypothetical protein [Gordonia amicalis]MDV7101787.1 hypothetical protein [Gordonia amicalis]UKO93330.1 hypothetical protein IHQ52_08455 [Gordonia amicalis]